MTMSPEINNINTIDLAIEGISCASCVATIEKAISKLPAVKSVNVNLSTERAHVVLKEFTSAQILIDAVIKAGYVAKLTSAKDDLVLSNDNNKDFIKIAVSLILTIPLLIPMIFSLLGISWNLSGFIQLMLATPVQFYIGAAFYQSAWKAIQNKTGNMDLLVAVGTSAAYFLSIYMLVRGHQHLYFEASSVIITLVLLGKYLEKRAKRQTTEAIRALQQLRPETAMVRKNNQDTELLVSEIKLKDLIVVRPGERIPVDGEVVDGISHTDESLMTGESKLVSKAAGSKVIAGSVNQDGLLLVNTTAIGSETTLSRIIRLVEDAQSAKPEIQKTVDKASAVFVPIVLVIATLTLLYWGVIHGNWEHAILNAVAVLVIACPCALGLATPSAIMAGTGVAAKYGILIKDANALEIAHKTTDVVFDKTGTLTEGKPALIEYLAVDGNHAKLLSYAASLEKNSLHPLAKSVVYYSQLNDYQLCETSNVQDFPGKGLKGTIDNLSIYIGNHRWMDELGVLIEPMMSHAIEMQGNGKTVSWVAIAKEANHPKLLGMLVFGDKIKSTSYSAISALREKDIKTHLLTGDNVISANQVTSELGIDYVFAEQTPESKAATITKIKKGNRIVAMVGDGVNDAPALATADVSFAMSSGTDVAMHTADITLMRSDPGLVAASIDVSRKTFNKIKQNLFWAFIYNLLGIPLAASGMLNPVIAGAAMALSSVSVVSNALLLKRWKPKS
jgi:Cu+-exporting ATPase